MTGFLIVDDHPMVRAALETALKRAFSEAQVYQSGTLAEAHKKLNSGETIDLVLLDLNIPETDGLAGLAELRTKFPRTPVLVVSGYDEQPYQAEARSAGAAGFVSKAAESERLVEAGEAVLDGDSYWRADVASNADADEANFLASIASLTPQQQRVLELLGQGLLNKQIAYELDIVESTVKAHVSAILRKLSVNSRTQAVLLAQKMRFNQLGATSAG